MKLCGKLLISRTKNDGFEGCVIVEIKLDKRAVKLDKRAVKSVRIYYCT